MLLEPITGITLDKPHTGEVLLDEEEGILTAGAHGFQVLSLTLITLSFALP